MLAALFVAFTLGRFFRFPARTFSGFLFSAGNPFLLCLLGGKTGFLCALLFLDAAGLGLFGFALGLFRRLAFGFGLAEPVPFLVGLLSLDCLFHGGQPVIDRIFLSALGFATAGLKHFGVGRHVLDGETPFTRSGHK